MRCDEVNRRELQWVSPEDPVRLAALKMREANVGFLPVVNADRTVAGVLTDRDIALRVVAEGMSSDTPVREVMTSDDIVACSPGDELEDAERLMRMHSISRIVLADDDDRIVGVVSLSDVVHHLGNEEESVAAVREVTEREVAEPFE